MGLMDYLKTQLLEIIQWEDDSRDTLSFRFPDEDKEIKRGAQLIVRESQVAQFVYLGQYGDTFGPGKHTLVFDFKYDGPGPGKGGTGVFSVDGRELARKTVKHTIPILMSIDETFDIGSDTRTGVDDSYELPFKFTGTINKLTFKLGPSQMTPDQQRAAVESVKKATD